MLSLEGRQLGNYDVIRRIRAGGMGAVYEGRQRTAFGRRVAIKVILGDYAEDRAMRRRFAHEAKTIARLHHPHILPLIEFGEEQGLLYLVMPFIEGGTLTSYLRRHLPDLHEVSTIFQQVLDAVEYAHEEGLIHRDIKSSNVLLEAQRNGPPYAYLADFGLVRTIQQDEMGRVIQQTGVAMPLDQVPGTPHYMAPEQTRGIVTPATDIYALGVLLYQMLLGELPYDDPDDIAVIKMHLHAPVPNPRDVDASIPVELGAVVTRAMSKRPEQRFPDVDAFRQALRAAIEGPAAHVAQTNDEEFDDEPEDDAFEVHEPPPRPQLPPRLPPVQLSPLPPLRASRPLPPLKSPSRPLHHPSAQLRLPGQPPRPLPTPIEFHEADAPPTTHRLRTTDDYGGPERRGRITEDQTLPDKRESRGGPRHGEAQRTGPGHEEQGRTAPLPPSASAPLVPVHPAHAGPRPRRRRPPLVLLVGVLLPLLLILFLLVSRALGMSIFPAGFPVLGTAPVATITLTVQTKQLSDTFLLTAAPQIAQANLATRMLPDRSISATVSASQHVATSGQKSTPGTQASGTLLFSNASLLPVTVANGTVFTTNTGIQVRLTHGSIVVPARVGNKNGTLEAPGEAVAPGQNGNLAPNALDVSCCGSPLVTVSNPVAFSGGIDTRIAHLVAQSDLDSVRDALLTSLQQQVLQRVESLLTATEVRVGIPTYSNVVTSNPPVGSVATQATVNVSLSVSVLAYDTHVASAVAQQLLSNEAAQTLGTSYQVRGGLNIAPPLFEQQGNSGQLYLSVAASGIWAYKVTANLEQAWRQAIKGASLPLAQNYLTTRPGISAVRISLPFGSDHIPTDEQQIVFVVN